VWAHPDDEVYLSAGLMNDARRAGARVVVVTATAGEGGTDDVSRWPPHRWAARRRDELRASLAILGVTEHRELGFPDGACAEHDGTDAIAALLRALRPDTIVTFGPDGMTGHPDHCAVSAWTTRAWRRSGRGRLWYATLTPGFHDRWGALNERVGMWSYTGAPPCTPVDELSHYVHLDGARLDRKYAALRAHSSQTDGLAGLVGEATFRSWWSTEAFVTAPLVEASGVATLVAPVELARPA
jgi:LmbE family N-acetylglucosaminyl deacetylase